MRDYSETKTQLTLNDIALIVAMLGVIFAFFLPKIIHTTDDAQTTATQGLANALASVAQDNNAKRSEKSTNGQAISNCTDVAKLLHDGSLPAGYEISPAPINSGLTVTCKLNGPSRTTAEFKVTGIN